tara:strand:- start:1636 stop:2064 length:429 start_codon:yes stop_codon:yes gene_type:complete
MNTLPTVDTLKQQARALRAALEPTTPVSHSQSLELVARQHGYRDWNTLFARLGNQHPAPRFAIGQFVNGRYLGHPFRARIRAVRERADGWFALDLKFDAPIDVVQFKNFSNYRSYVSCTVNGLGRTFEKTSDGQPHVVLDLA